MFLGCLSISVYSPACMHAQAGAFADQPPTRHKVGRFGDVLWAAGRLPQLAIVIKGNGSPYSITERRVPELIPVLGSQPAGDVSHKPGGRLPLPSARPAVTPATLKRAATDFADW